MNISVGQEGRAMPNRKTRDLPYQVVGTLPERARHIYLKVLDGALEEYEETHTSADPEPERDDIAHQLAWAAVNNEYHKEGARWVRNVV
jgi:cation transport regulator